MEKNIEISTKDNFLIDGILNYVNKKKDDLIIFVHGLSDNYKHRLVFNASKFFKNNNFDTFRFSLYSGGKHGRILDDCCFQTFINDTDTVIKHFASQYKNIFLVGHSLGYLILKSDLSSIKKIALWEPSCNLNKRKSRTINYDKELNQYSINWGVTFLINKQLKDDWINIDDLDMVGKLNVPIGLFMAENSSLKSTWKGYVKSLNVKHKFVIIENANHGFSEENTEEDLFKQTLNWFVE